MAGRSIDMTGRKFGALTGLRRIGLVESNGNAVWLFRCECGNEREAIAYEVRTGKTFACRECAAEALRQATVKHEMTNSAEFAIWTGMKTRCYNARSKSYADYGGRGIVLCDRWRDSFAAFYADMGPRPSRSHSIERDDVNGNYEPGNCRWATSQEQALNKRTNHRIEIGGVTKTLTEWSRESGLFSSTIRLRQKAGRTGADLLAPSRCRVKPNRVYSKERNRD